MLPDITIKDFYLQFIHNAKTDSIAYKSKLENVLKAKNSLIEYINNNKSILLSDFNINLDRYKIEWVDKTYNPTKNLYQKLVKLLTDIEEHPNRIVIIQLIKYCNVLAIEYRCRKSIEQCEFRKDIKPGQYRQYVTDYYAKVQRCVLQGMGYKFSNGIGTFICNYWKMNADTMAKHPRIDFAATNKRKKELIAKGVKLYDEKEAAWYKARNIPYDAVDYRVWRTNTNWYEFTFIKTRLAKSSSYDFKHTEYISKKYRGMTAEQMANELCRCEEDIYTLQVDIKYKLNILLHKDPTKYLNYVRNAEQDKSKPGAHNS